jgi:hypothetical protein
LVRSVPGLPGKGSSQAGDDQSLAAGSTILLRESTNERLDLGTGIGERHGVKLEVGRRFDPDQVPALHEPRHLGSASEEGEVVVLGHPELPFHRSRRSSKALALQREAPKDPCAEEDAGEGGSKNGSVIDCSAPEGSVLDHGPGGIRSWRIRDPALGIELEHLRECVNI